MDECERAELLARIDRTSEELQALIVRAQALVLPSATVPLRAPVLEGLQKQIQLAKKFLAGEFVDRRQGYGRRATDHLP